MKKLALILLALLICPFALAQVNRSAKLAGTSYDGQGITCDLAPQEQFRNIGSKIDNAGMCVFSSIEMAAKAQGIEQMRGFRDWWASVSRGGGWPQQVDKSLDAWWKHKQIEPIPYYQYEGREPEKVLALIDKTSRMACVTYGWSERMGYGSHMVNCSTFRGKYAVVLDNNFPSIKTADGWNENIYEWMSKEELCRRAKLTGGSAWIFCWLVPPAPPPARSVPKN